MNHDPHRPAANSASLSGEDAYRRLHALGLVGLRRNMCIAASRPAGMCERCKIACPHACLTIGESGPTLEPTACSACGMCAAACPTGALSVDGVTLPTHVPAQGLVLACERSRAATDAPVLRLACLGALAVNDWLRLTIAAGDAPIRVADDGACAGCSNAPSHEAPWRSTLEIARRALSEAGMLPNRLPVAMTPDALPNSNRSNTAIAELPIEGRRRFFAGLSRSLASAISQAATGERVSSSAAGAQARRHASVAAHRGAETRVLLQHIASSSGQPHPRSALLPALMASDACRAHGACSRACPTGALHLETGHDDGQARLQFDAWLCVDCGACARICPSYALDHQPRAWRPFADVPVVLATIRQSECERCGALFDAHEDEALCERCRKTENLARAGFALFSRQHRDTPAVPEGP
ncbi:4Fe-4S dicluster domain-containing protein [Aromatoleum evansii]|uniref:4Fe-4S dicluster domain-containing protein n=1 Tax=Aromatoleum evansii TaxID=59406 RepID=A0ABZ1AFT5_AROEV|nr:4Fe-4S dicluster domain-containing protein [Aromatoleum evansii]